jgi:hypothetical protein
MTEERGSVRTMSGTDFSGLLPGPRPLTVEELARQQGVQPFGPSDDVRVDLWESDEEFDAFLADTRAARQEDLA